MDKMQKKTWSNCKHENKKRSNLQSSSGFSSKLIVI